MSRRLVIAPLADQELLAAHDWYEAQRKGLGKEFRTAVRDALRQIRAHPETRPPYFRDIRRVRLRRFTSYWVYYRVTDDHILVITVFHSSRDPEDLAQALGGTPP